ncbi:MAG: hypothetical protein QOH91_2981 [Mycobacterium sp.]|nr:hypothetical protein [Mycobacterium sp.]
MLIVEKSVGIEVWEWCGSYERGWGTSQGWGGRDYARDLVGLVPAIWSG